MVTTSADKALSHGNLTVSRLDLAAPTGPGNEVSDRSEVADAYMCGYGDGHEHGIAIGGMTQAVVHQLQAVAWDSGYDVGHADGADEARADVGQTITDLAARYADIDESFTRFAHASREQRIADRVAAMEQDAAKLHAAIGTKPWVGLENGGVLPSADWDTNSRNRNGTA